MQSAKILWDDAFPQNNRKSVLSVTLAAAGLAFMLSAGYVRAQVPAKTVVAPESKTALEEASSHTTASHADAEPSVAARSATTPYFVIGNDDVLAIQVWKEPDVSRTLPVRTDGKISLPLAGELQAAGRTPSELESDIVGRLKVYITDPLVTVIVQEINSQKFNILGQVARPGSYPLTRATTVLDAIAIAGGFRDFAKQKGIYILRAETDGRERRIPFNYKTAIKGGTSGQNVRLEPRDTVIVP